MFSVNSLRSALTLMLLSLTLPAFAGPSGYHILKTVPLPGQPAWDYLNFDPTSQLIYLANSDQALVLDTTGKVVGSLTGTTGIHSALPVPEVGMGFTSNGDLSTVTIFDLKSLKVLGQVPVGTKPDAMGYDPASGCVYVCNGKSSNASVIEASSGGVAATIPLGGKPEYLAADGKGMIYINIEDKDSVAVIDTHQWKVVKTFTLPAGSNPSSMAIDKNNGKLFIGCRNKTLVVVDTHSGQIVQSLPLGEHVDATVFDSGTGYIFSTCADGTISVIHQDSANTYSVVENIQSVAGAHTLALDPQTHQLFVPTDDKKQFSLLIFGK